MYFSTVILSGFCKINQVWKQNKKQLSPKAAFVKFRFSEKATKIWSYHPLDLTFTRNIWIIFSLLFKTLYHLDWYLNSGTLFGGKNSQNFLYKYIYWFLPSLSMCNYLKLSKKYVWNCVVSVSVTALAESKVQIFWEGHKNLELSPTWFDVY